MKRRSQIFERALQSIAHDEHDFVNALRLIKTLPGVCDERATCHLQEKFIHSRAHARALASGDDNGGSHNLVSSFVFRVKKPVCGRAS
jgi:hypothetical protein